MKKEGKQSIGYILFAYGIGILYAAIYSAFQNMLGGVFYSAVLSFILIVIGSHLITLSK